ncbi:uncharacterized protein N7473_002984 [Penicillium subrubescens]|uniref:uncharacterized protein n=1 Tax=Penicillium subrubescens TaxID=1316194 RepID=UPI0025455A9A|nr:uncharacterized protein N7473_002984 [Penicillium subrubescens]KAJ5906068.1 hypothetical protein N7473_002984 [Penicillium subrubescens]
MIRLYDDTFKNSNPNCIVIWHSVCISMTADIDILSRAAGRDGAESMVEARKALAYWDPVPSQASRWYCVPTGSNAVTAALVLGVYILTSTRSSHSDTFNDEKPFDLANTSMDWKVVGDEGFSTSESSIRDNTEGVESDAVRCIRFGGPIVIDRKIYDSGARHAQRIILEFASLLDEVGTHWMADYARLLYMTHDTMAE